MRGILDYMIQFTELGGMLYIMVGLFLIGFLMKTIGNFYYDILLDKIEKGTWKTYRWISDLTTNSESLKMSEDLMIEIKRKMHNWKCIGIPVERMQYLGDALAGIILILGVYSYLSVSIVLCITLKIWDKVLGVEYKHNVIQDELYACLAYNENCELQEKIAVVNVEIKKEEAVQEQEQREPVKKKVSIAETGKKQKEFSKSKEEVFDEMLNEFLS